MKLNGNAHSQNTSILMSANGIEKMPLLGNALPIIKMLKEKDLKY